MDRLDVINAWETLRMGDELAYTLHGTIYDYDKADEVIDLLLRSGTQGWCEEVRKCIAEHPYKNFDGIRELWFVFMLCELTGEQQLYKKIEGFYDKEELPFEDWLNKETWEERQEAEQRAFEKYDCRTGIQQLLFEYGMVAAREYFS